MKQTLYLEPSVISYYTNPLSSDPKILGEQEITQLWWKKILPQLDIFISPFVIREISQGRKEQIQTRLLAIEGFSLLNSTNEVEKLAHVYIQKLALPKNGQMDAFHLAIAAVHKVDFLLSWNCKHIANAFKYPLIRKINTSMGHFSPTICTPRELMELG